MRQTIVDGTTYAHSAIGEYGCPVGQERVLKRIETVIDDHDLVDVYCVINNQRFPWSLDEENYWTYMREWRDDYLDDIHSRYYKFGDGESFWCLVSAWNYDVDYESDDNGEYPGTKVWPDDAEVNRWLFMVYKSGSPNRFDMRPGLEFDINGIQRGSGDGVDCVGFDADYGLEEVVYAETWESGGQVRLADPQSGIDALYYPADVWAFAIPGFAENSGLRDPDGGPLLCLGTYRLLRIVETLDTITTKTEKEFELEG